MPLRRTRAQLIEDSLRMERETSRERFDEIDIKRIQGILAGGQQHYWEALFKDVPDKSLLGRCIQLLAFLTQKKWKRCHALVVWFTERTPKYRELKRKFDKHFNSRENPDDTCEDYVNLS